MKEYAYVREITECFIYVEKRCLLREEEKRLGLYSLYVDKMFACYVVVVTKMFTKCAGLNSPERVSGY